MRPLLSVVIANRDREPYLKNSLRYWREQFLIPKEDIDLVVVDDGSASPPSDTCEEFGARLLVISGSRKRKGPSIAWNCGLMNSNGVVKACTHAEIIPSVDCARFLVGSCLGDKRLLSDANVWIPDARDGTLHERTVEGKNIARMGNSVLRANIVTLRLSAEHQRYITNILTTDELQKTPGFWNFKTEFGGHTNHEILRVLRGFFWNNLFAMRSEVWEWINYFRPSDDWGIDDTDFQERNAFLHITYAFSDNVFAYHQYHESGFRSGVNDLYKFKNEDDARLLFMYPEHRDYELKLSRERFWSD